MFITLSELSQIPINPLSGQDTEPMKYLGIFLGAPMSVTVPGPQRRSLQITSVLIPKTYNLV